MGLLKNSILIPIFIVIASTFTLGAILGQVDSQMCAFYCQNNYNAYWQFPWGKFTNIEAWIQEYIIIVICYAIAFISGISIGKGLSPFNPQKEDGKKP